MIKAKDLNFIWKLFWQLSFYKQKIVIENNYACMFIGKQIFAFWWIQFNLHRSKEGFSAIIYK